MGQYSDVLTVKTGKKGKPAVKSIKVSNVKQKKTYIPSKLWWDAGGVKHYVKGHYTYTTTYKITVKLKKKPGTKGICIGDHKLKGNKKTYTLKVKSSGKLKGKKVKVSVMSYNNNTYGAYSGIYTKKIKIK